MSHLNNNLSYRSYEEEGSRRRYDAESKIAHETTDALTLSGHARTPSGCKSGDIKRTIIDIGIFLPYYAPIFLIDRDSGWRLTVQELSERSDAGSDALRRSGEQGRSGG
jgi:hypothetical protein